MYLIICLYDSYLYTVYVSVQRNIVIALTVYGFVCSYGPYCPGHVALTVLDTLLLLS